MSNMNKKTRNRLYPIIAKRDGEYCKCCGKLPHETSLILDHRDNDNYNNSHTNLQLLCRSCNYIKNPRKEPLDFCVRDSFEERLSKFKEKENKFAEYLDERIEDSYAYAIEIEDAINSGAQKVDISIETAKRYLKKLISNEGRFKKYDYNNSPSIISKKEIPKFYRMLIDEN